MNADLYRPSSFVGRNDRSDPVLQKVDTLYRFVRFEQRRPKRQRNRLEMRFQKSVISAVEATQEKVFRRNGHAPGAEIDKTEDPFACARESRQEITAVY